MTEEADFKRWKTLALLDRTPVETVQISHVSWGNLFLARWHEDFSATLEDGSDALFKAADFFLEPAEIADTTEQNARAVIAGLDGRIYDVLTAMSPADRLQPITVTPRVFFADNPNLPLNVPPAVWTVAAITAEREQVTAELRSRPLRRRRLGRYYTIQEFPTLAFV